MKLDIAKPWAAWCVVVACAVWAGASAQNRELGGAGTLLDGVAAVVDEGVVLKSELEDAVTTWQREESLRQSRLPANQRQGLPPRSQIEELALEALIVREIQRQHAVRRNITVSDTDLNEALAQMAEEAGFSLDELPTLIAAEGEDYRTFREDQRTSLRIETLRRAEMRRRIGSIPQREMERCLAESLESQADIFEYNTSAILISVPSTASPGEIEAARRRADAIHARLEAGEDFARVAIAESDAQTALEGGGLGWRNRSRLPAVFADVVPRLQPGEFSAPLQSQSGFNIVRLNEMRGSARQMVDQVKARHILLKPTEIMDDAAVRQRLLGLREQLLNGGAEFGPLARSLSEDSISASNGGDLDWFSPGDMVPEFEERVWNQPLDTISEPFRTRNGWHIVEVTGRRSHDVTDERRERQCENDIIDALVAEEEELWLRELRDQAFVDIRL